MHTSHPNEDDISIILEQLNAENKTLRRAIDVLSMLNDLSLSISGTGV